MSEQAEAGEPKTLQERIEECPGRLDRLSIRERTLRHQFEDYQKLNEAVAQEQADQIDALSDGLDAWAGRIQKLEVLINPVPSSLHEDQLREWQNAATWILRTIGAFPQNTYDNTTVGLNNYTVRLAHKLCEVVVDPDEGRLPEMIKTLRCSCDYCNTVTYCSLENGNEWLCNRCLVTVRKK